MECSSDGVITASISIASDCNVQQAPVEENWVKVIKSFTNYGSRIFHRNHITVGLMVQSFKSFKKCLGF